jgi:hypothetical protein
MTSLVGIKAGNDTDEFMEKPLKAEEIVGMIRERVTEVGVFSHEAG